MKLLPQEIRKEIENADRKVIMALRGNGMIATKRGSFPVSDTERLKVYLEGRNGRAAYIGCAPVTVEDYARMAGVEKRPDGYVELSRHNGYRS